MNPTAQSIPENIRRCMSESDRKALDVPTAAECADRHNAHLERKLLKLAMQELSRRGVRVVHHLSTRAREHAGYPDLTFAWNGTPYAVELKSKTGRLSADQEAMLSAMHLDGWVTYVCRDFDDLRAWLDRQEIYHGRKGNKGNE